MFDTRETYQRSDHKIIFFGTPAFAVPPLRKMIESGFNIAAVVTVEDKFAGRGLNLMQSDVKKCAMEYQIPVFQPATLDNPDFIDQIREIAPTVQVVIAFRKLPENVWAIPRYGTINLHASLLPQYRGAAPINWVIINGEKETGLTTFFISHNIDTGDIIHQEKIAIDPNDNAGSLHDKLSVKGSELIVKTLDAVLKGMAPRIPQQLTGELKKAPKLTRDICHISWDQPAEAICNLIRGLSPYPCAWTYWDKTQYKIYHAACEDADHSFPVGQLCSDGKRELKVAVKDGFVKILELQPEGRKRITAEEFLRGHVVKSHTIAGNQ